jgi:hypothetical protein
MGWHRAASGQLAGALGPSSSQVARAIGVLPDSVRRITQEEMQLSPKMAVRFSRHFRFWTPSGALRVTHVQMSPIFNAGGARKVDFMIFQPRRIFRR